MSKKRHLCSAISSRRCYSRQGDDLIHGLVKHASDDFADDICNRILNLFVVAHLILCLGVYIDLALRLVSVLDEDAVVTLIFDVQHVFGANCFCLEVFLTTLSILVLLNSFIPSIKIIETWCWRSSALSAYNTRWMILLALCSCLANLAQICTGIIF